MSDLHITQVNLCLTCFYQSALCSAFNINPPMLLIYLCLYTFYSYQDIWAKPDTLQKAVDFQKGSIVQKSTFIWS